MKKLILALSLVLLFASPSFAKPSVVVHQTLETSTGVDIVDLAISTGVAVYSERIFVGDDAGVRSLLIIEDKAGGLGDVDISMEYSMDGTNFYPGYTSSASALTIEPNLVTAFGNGSRYIQVPTGIVSKWIRIKFDPDANSEITASFCYLSDQL